MILNNLNKIIEKFDDFNERSNIIAERYNFLSRKQRQDKTCDEFATAQSLLVASCNYEKPSSHPFKKDHGNALV